ncbi:MAG: tyrosine-type recombinase/integrase, partial [Microthrixaceae bacterium]
MAAPLHRIGRVSVVQGATGGKRFRIRYTDGLGRRRERTATTEATALEIARSVDRQLAEPGGALQPGAPFVNLVNDWVMAEDRSDRHWSARQFDSMSYAARCFIIPELGSKRCHEITSASLNGLLVSMKRDGYADSTVKAVFQCLRGTCAWGVECQVWSGERNPGTRMKLPRGVKNAGQSISERIDASAVPSHGEVAAFVTAAYERRAEFGLLVETAAASGLRFGELAALTKSDVDVAERALKVTKTLVTSASEGRFVGLPKSHAGFRVVYIPSVLAAKLRKHLRGRKADELVFTSSRGKALHHSNMMRREFHPAARASGFPSRFTFHSLRHHAIT